MPRPRRIPPDQLERVRRLEEQLERSAWAGNLRRGKLALDDLRDILRRYGHETRVQQAYVKLYEAALEAGQLEIAKRGLEGVRRQTRKNTKESIQGAN